MIPALTHAYFGLAGCSVKIGEPHAPQKHLSQFSFEGFVKDGGKQGVYLGDGLGLQAPQRVHLQEIPT